MNLRPYQQDVINKVLTGFNEFARQLAVLPTGAGKTIVFSHLAKMLQPKRTLILAHREELILQAADKLHKATGIFASIEKAEYEASKQAPVVVASVQTMIRRLDKWPADHFGLVVADEAHHAISDSWQKVLRHFQAWTLGVTATPDRGDKRNLGQYFENIAAEVTLFDLIHQGYLSRISVQAVPLKIELNNVKQTAGDYDANQLGDALAPYMRSIAQAIRTHADFRRTLVFLPLIATSKAFVDVCRSEGLNAEHIDGYSEDRKDILQRYASGEIDVLCNAMLLTEGFDDAGIECVVILRPTRSRSLYSQMVGRGTRIAPGKQDLLLLDFLWMHETHNLIRPAHLVATSDAQAEEISAEAFDKAAGGETQMPLDLEGLASETQAKREEKLRKELEAKAKRKAKVIDAMEFCLSMHAPAEVTEWEDTMGWHAKGITPGQASVLSRNGIDLESVRSRGHASALIDLIISRSKLNLCTPKQMRMLQRFGVQNPETKTFQEAKAILDKRIGQPA